jgi:acyl CoA:acetate/3-ketoacid CoA transferase
VVFVGTFTAGQIAVEDGRLHIVKDGKVKKFVLDV